MITPRKNSEFRFLKNIQVNLNNGCWEWTASLNKGGYGNFTCGTILGAHRYSFWLFKGELETTKVIDHECRNKKCVNPEHLRQVTYSINSIENSNSPAYIHSIKTHCPKGHEYNKENLLNITNRKFSRVCKICNRERRSIWYMKNKEIWNEHRRNKRKLGRNTLQTKQFK